VQKYLKKRKCQTLWNYYVTGFVEGMDIAGEFVFFLRRNFLKCTVTDTLTTVVL
jgi:hypothetical protein